MDIHEFSSCEKCLQRTCMNKIRSFYLAILFFSDITEKLRVNITVLTILFSEFWVYISKFRFFYLSILSLHLVKFLYQNSEAEKQPEFLTKINLFLFHDWNWLPYKHGYLRSIQNNYLINKMSQFCRSQESSFKITTKLSATQICLHSLSAQYVFEKLFYIHKIVNSCFSIL